MCSDLAVNLSLMPYYLLVALKKEWCVKDINKYLNTWFDLENSCDCYVLGKLNFAKSLYEKAA